MISFVPEAEILSYNLRPRNRPDTQNKDLHKVLDKTCVSDQTEHIAQDMQSVRSESVHSSELHIAPDTLSTHPELPGLEGQDRSAKVYLDMADKQRAETLLIKAIQSQHFGKEIETLLKLGVFDPNSVNELKTKSSGLISDSSWFMSAFSLFIRSTSLNVAISCFT